MQIADKLKKCRSKPEKAKAIWDHYLERKRRDDLEPTWVHPAYELMRDYGSLREKHMADQIIESHEFADGHVVWGVPGIPQFGKRIMHDGWKLGTPTWIFMGRALPHNYCERCNDDLVIVGRRIPQRLLPHPAPEMEFIAYQLSEPMGMTALTANCYGPCSSLEQLKSVLRSG